MRLMIDHVLPWDDVEQAFEALRQGQSFESDRP